VIKQYCVDLDFEKLGINSFALLRIKLLSNFWNQDNIECLNNKIKEDKEIGKNKNQKRNIFSKFKSTFSYKITQEEFEEIFEELEMLLLENNVALEVVDDIKLKLSERLIGIEVEKRRNRK